MLKFNLPGQGRSEVGFAAAVEGSPGDTKKTHQGRKLEKADRSGVGRDGMKQDGALQGFERTLWGCVGQHSLQESGSSASLER